MYGNTRIDMFELAADASLPYCPRVCELEGGGAAAVQVTGLGRQRLAAAPLLPSSCKVRGDCSIHENAHPRQTLEELHRVPYARCTSASNILTDGGGGGTQA